jgi:RNA methyltransferase, TrmH family
MTLLDRFRTARRAPDRAVLEGFHPLKHALRFGAAVEVVVVAGDDSALRAAAAGLAPDVLDAFEGVERVAVSDEVFGSLMPARPAERVIAIARRPAFDAAAVAAAPGRIVLLEEPSHLPNIGAAVRVSAAAGCAALLTTGVHDPWHAAALRGSAGLHFALPVARVESADALPPPHRPLVALDPAGEPLRPGLVPADALLAFGSERRGLSAELRGRADLRVGIPMRAGVSSLSLATAVAVALYAG